MPMPQTYPRGSPVRTVQQIRTPAANSAAAMLPS
jgi:hypothetical protein